MIKIQTRVKNLLGFQAQNENQNYKNKKIRLASDFLKASDNSREQGTSGKEGASHRFDVQQLSCRSLGCGPGRPSPPHSHRTFSVVTTGGWRAAGTRWAVGSKLLRPRMRRTAPHDWIPQPQMKSGVEVEKPSWEEQLWAHQDSGSPVYLYPSWRICGWTLDNQEMKGKMWARGLVKTTSRIYL